MKEEGLTEREGVKGEVLTEKRGERRGGEGRGGDRERG